MSALFEVVAGWTGPLGPFTLKLNGTPFVLTGYNIELELTDSLGNSRVGGGTIDVANQITNPGEITYNPIDTDFQFAASGNLRRQSYLMHWKVTDGANKVVYFPNGLASEISVYKP